MRRRQYLGLGLVVFVTFSLWSLLRIRDDGKRTGPKVDFSAPPEGMGKPVPVEDRRHRQTPPEKKPKATRDASSHPIWTLISEARQDFEELRGRQSKTVAEAVAEYERRHGIPPPPHFDKWFEFAQANDVQLVDEFDMVMDMITPFWGLKPKTIRARLREALGYDNFLMMLLIRDHEVTHVQGAHEWQRDATADMVSKFIQYLPDMDLAFNIHDEPRVIVPHDDLVRLVRTAKEFNMPKLNAAKNGKEAGGRRLENTFTRHPKGLGGGGGMEEFKTTRFNVYAHQPTWTTSRMSCPADSPARELDDDERFDDASRYGYSELGLVYNETAMSDICLSPSLSETYGFFDRPNAFNVVHDLLPIFSQSKISSYNDILYPSPWYWQEKVEYDGARDKPWDEKRDQLYWRGSTTGGFSRDGGWRRQHRQHLVRKINGGGHVVIYENKGGGDGSSSNSNDNENSSDDDDGSSKANDGHPDWKPRLVSRSDFKSAVDVRFSHIGQCDDGDCEAQAEFFDVASRADQQDAWRYKFLLDMDGNAFSGRFYAFLRSHSLVFKLALFREWHFGWLKPWVHYVPFSLQGEDWLEAVRFFGGGDGKVGAREAERMAGESREWAGKVLRKEDMEAWFFRLLLEYSRVIDDNRENLGFSL